MPTINLGKIMGLTGPKGDKGDRGDPGAAGAAGPQGPAGKDAVVTVYTATIPTTGWSESAPYTVTVPVSGVTAAMSPIIDVVLSATAETARAQLEAWDMVGRVATYAGGITVTCFYGKPGTAIPVQMRAVQ